jgi:hypothetical protein
MPGTTGACPALAGSRSSAVSSLKVTADTYAHVLLDDRELELDRLLAEC